ncbi:PqqD family peptide modification chaperone [Cryptosporangium minutisporangium]|uniref:Peptide zinc metalloprotease protein n=1 Tax=Cryptosporangium minutisporangium TaxID=113569 RepID=A0ABP6SZ00_9ACTN
MTISAPALRQDLELLRGMDDLPLIFDPVSGRYHRISPSAERLIQLLDGRRTTDDLAELLASGPENVGSARRLLDPFLDNLETSGLLVGSAPPEASHRRRISRERLMPRFVVSRSLPRLLEPVTRVVAISAARWLGVVAAVLAVLGFAAGAWTISWSPERILHHGTAVLIAVVLQLGLILLHELSHALVAQYLRVPVRGLGVALLFYFLPVAYVDRTDAYRVRKRPGRIALALAGVVCDGIACGVTAIVAVVADGFVQNVAVALIGIQLTALLVNLNPLLPSDGYAALEASTGWIDVRGRSLALLGLTARRKPLPSYLANLPDWSKALHAAFGLFCFLYGCFLVVWVLSALWPVADLLIGVVL